MARLESGQPSSKLILVASLQQRRWESLLRFTRFGRVSYLHPMDQDPANWLTNQDPGQRESRDQLFAAKWLCDLDMTWKVNALFQLGLGVSNALNVYPDRHHHYANTHHGVLKHSIRLIILQIQQISSKVYTSFTLPTAGLKPSATLAINEHCNRLLAEGKDVIKLGFGQSPFTVPPSVVAALRDNAYLRNTYFGETTEAANACGLNGDPSLDCINAGKVVTDLSFGYQFAPNLSLNIGQITYLTFIQMKRGK